MDEDLREAVEHAALAVAAAKSRCEFLAAMPRDELEAMVAALVAKGTDVCRHCGRAEPHQHYIDRKGFAHPGHAQVPKSDGPEA